MMLMLMGPKIFENAARKFNINKIIFTSSVAIYGSAKPNTGENGDINFFNDYGKPNTRQN